MATEGSQMAYPVLRGRIPQGPSALTSSHREGYRRGPVMLRYGPGDLTGAQQQGYLARTVTIPALVGKVTWGMR